MSEDKAKRKATRVAYEFPALSRLAYGSLPTVRAAAAAVGQSKRLSVRRVPGERMN